MIKVGDWVTQYSVGYWQVLEIIPKYADEDYDYGGKSWKKGDRLGEWMILKKGFTPKMKPSNTCEFVDSQWCKPVSSEELRLIEAAFAENPKAKQRFDRAASLPKPAVASIWLKLSDAQADAFSALLAKMPERFTQDQLWATAEEFKACEVDASRATHILYVFSYLWEINEAFEPLHFGPELRKYE